MSRSLSAEKLIGEEKELNYQFGQLEKDIGESQGGL